MVRGVPGSDIIQGMGDDRVWRGLSRPFGLAEGERNRKDQDEQNDGAETSVPPVALLEECPADRDGGNNRCQDHRQDSQRDEARG